MTTKPTDEKLNINAQEVQMDTSIQEAKWLLGSVAGLGVFVISLGMTASVLAG